MAERSAHKGRQLDGEQYENTLPHFTCALQPFSEVAKVGVCKVDYKLIWHHGWLQTAVCLLSLAPAVAGSRCHAFATHAH